MWTPKSRTRIIIRLARHHEEIGIVIYKTVGADAEAELNPHRWTEPPLQHEDSRLAVRTNTSSHVEWMVKTPQASSE